MSNKLDKPQSVDNIDPTNVENTDRTAKAETPSKISKCEIVKNQ